MNYQPVVHVGTVRQAAKITLMNSEVLRTGDKALCHFCFMYRPEYLTTGRRSVPFPLSLARPPWRSQRQHGLPADQPPLSAPLGQCMPCW